MISECEASIPRTLAPSHRAQLFIQSKSKREKEHCTSMRQMSAALALQDCKLQTLIF